MQPLRLFMVLAWSFGAVAAAYAQPWPGKPIRLVVPYAPGGATDVLARSMAQRVGDALGTQVVVDNKPGGNTLIGAEAVAKAPPDGYTLLLTTGVAVSIAPHLYTRMPYDPARELMPVAKLAFNPYVIYAHPSVPANTVRELVAYEKAHPNKLNVGLPGSATPPHFSIKSFEMVSGTTYMPIQFKGAALALNDLIAGHIDLVVDSPVVGLPYVAAGKLKAIAVTSPKRLPNHPDLPTVAETYPGFESSSWFGVMAPAGTPADIVERLNGEIRKFLNDPPTRERMVAQGMVPDPGSAADLGRFIQSETLYWKDFFAKTGLKLE